jgi:ubiquinone/menaquinone biosynthesis C-methylase UbiE
MEESNPNNKVKNYYDAFWKKSIKKSNEDLIIGFHYGYYEKGITNWKEAVLNMNDFVGKLIGLNDKKKMEILDAGCGAGSVSNYLARKYPNINFTGITLSPFEVKLATKIKKENHLGNTKFFVGNYNKTGLQDNTYDGVFAIESTCYAHNKLEFLYETYRVLKSGRKIVIADGFLVSEISPHSFLEKVYKRFLEKRAISNLTTIKTFKSYLKTVGFKEIKIRNISKNLLYYYFSKDFIKFILHISKEYFERMITRKEKVNEYNTVTLIEFFLGLTKKINYYIVMATK